MAFSMLDLPPNVLDQIVKLLPGNSSRSVRAACRELRCLANEATDFLCLDISDETQWKEVKAIPASFLPHLKTIRLKLPERCTPQEFHEALAALNITATKPTTGIQLVVGSAEAYGHFMPSIQFSLLVQGLIRARLWQRVRKLSFSCEHWVGPEISFGANVMVQAHIRLSERDARLNRKLLRATLMQPGLTELTISEMLPQDLDAGLVRMLGERQSTLTSLTLRVCDISRHDADVPLVFDLRPLAQAGFPKLTHFVVESSCHGPVRLVAVDGLPLLAEHCMPSLNSLALRGLSQVPLSTERTSRRRYSSLSASPACRLKVEHLPHIRMAVPDFRPFIGLKTLELSAWELGNLALLPCLPGLESLVLHALMASKDACKRPRLSGSEFVGLPHLRHLVLNRLDCPYGLTSASLEHLELTNTTLCQIHVLTGHSKLPSLASVLVTERDRTAGEQWACWRIGSLLVEAAGAGSPGGVRLPSIGCPASSEEHASKVRKMPARMHACTQTGAEAAAQVYWVFQELCSESSPEFVREEGMREMQRPPETGSVYIKNIEKPGAQVWRVPVNFSFRLVKHSSRNQQA